MTNKAVAVVGMCGSGKSVVTDLFLNLGWQRVYFGGVTVQQLKKENLAVNEKNERAMREGLRQKHGMGAFAVILIDEILEKLKVSNTVLDGLYSWSEYKFLKEKLKDNLIVLAVVTNGGLRKERLKTRNERPLNADEVLSRDVSEIENLEKGGPISIADFYILNNGTEEDLKKQIEDFLKWFDAIA